MKIGCPCGGVIVDGTDAHPNKAHMVADQDWFRFWEAVDAAIEQPCSSPKEAEARCIHLRELNVARFMWQCEQCGMLFMETHDHELAMFRPEDKAVARGILAATGPCGEIDEVTGPGAC